MANQMRIKEGVEISSSDFWYDLDRGGYIKPAEILVDAEDIKNVENAIRVIREFQVACETQIEGFEQ
jgi:hypothetical protein